MDHFFQITDIKDVREFAKHLTYIEKLNFHPDNDFNEYINFETRQPSYSENEIKVRNHAMNRCFEICKKENADIYDIMSEHLFV